tara:strand:- start:223 stop:384 length:162 start_codon:yes stop_codon:yes gene_type:complete
MVENMDMFNEFMSMPINFKSIIVAISVSTMMSLWFWGFIEFIGYLIEKGGKNV